MLVELLELDQDQNHCEENRRLGGEPDEPSQVVDVHWVILPPDRQK
jgi:hypothetical protein